MNLRTALSAATSALVLLAGPALAESHSEGDNQAAFAVTGSDGLELSAMPLATFDGAWAMTFLPDGRALVTEKDGDLWLLGTDGKKLGRIDGVPEVTPRGQGGLGDIILHPDFADNDRVYVSYVERDEDDDSLSRAAVMRAKLSLSDDGGRLRSKKVIWTQSHFVTGNGHYGHRLAVGPEGYLWITSGERQKFSPAQNMDMTLGKIIRLEADGSVPEDNPFYEAGGVTAEIWSLGHRNPLGIDFDAEGRLWVHEMGPRHGDELNLIIAGENYGYPLVSDGDHYSGDEIPDHDTNPEYENPAISWVPAISPAGFVIYDGEMFTDWQGNAFIGGLSSQALIRVSFEMQPTDNLGQPPKDYQTEPVGTEEARYEWGKRIREVEQGPDGAIYVLEDKDGGRLVRLTPASQESAEAEADDDMTGKPAAEDATLETDPPADTGDRVEDTEIAMEADEDMVDAVEGRTNPAAEASVSSSPTEVPVVDAEDVDNPSTDDSEVPENVPDTLADAMDEADVLDEVTPDEPGEEGSDGND
jgi:aldose sugar dehydrogenase